MIEFHADDYGLFPAQSERILACREEGVLNGVSIMPESPHLPECMEMLKARYGDDHQDGFCLDDFRLTIHLNIMEGKALSPAEKVPHLTAPDGTFSISFGKLLLLGWVPFVRGKVREELKTELRSQIRRCLPYFEEGTGKLNLDSHGHYHMLPLFFDALAEIIREDGLQVERIRFPREDILMYLRHAGEIKDLLPINFIKVLVLNTLSFRNRIRWNRLWKECGSWAFMGVMLSGHMTPENIRPLLDEIRKKQEGNIEVLFHPGSVLEKEDVEKLTDAGDLSFLTSPLRAGEAASLKMLRKYF